MTATDSLGTFTLQAYSSVSLVLKTRPPQTSVGAYTFEAYGKIEDADIVVDTTEDIRLLPD